jgi:hypothetical protein
MYLFNQNKFIIIKLSELEKVLYDWFIPYKKYVNMIRELFLKKMNYVNMLEFYFFSKLTRVLEIKT